MRKSTYKQEDDDDDGNTAQQHRRYTQNVQCRTKIASKVVAALECKMCVENFSIFVCFKAISCLPTLLNIIIS